MLLRSSLPAFLSHARLKPSRYNNLPFPPFQPSSLPAFLPSRLPAFPPSRLPAFLPYNEQQMRRIVPLFLILVLAVPLSAIRQPLRARHGMVVAMEAIAGGLMRLALISLRATTSGDVGKLVGCKTCACRAAVGLGLQFA